MGDTEVSKEISRSEYLMVTFGVILKGGDQGYMLGDSKAYRVND